MRGAFGAMLVVLAANPAHAQQARTELDSGKLVRIHTVDGVTEARLLRSVLSTSGDIEYCVWSWNPCLQSPGDQRTLPRADIKQLDVHHTWSGRGALIEFAVGAAVIVIDQKALQLDQCECPNHVLTFATVGGILFAIPGAIIGAFFTRWVPVPF